MSRKVAGGGLGTIVLVLVGLYFGIDPGVILQSTGALAPPAQTSQVALSPEEQELGEFVSVVLADTEDTWHAIFQQAGSEYREPKLVLFSGAVESACGYAQAAVGPFYCPRDQKLYIDLSFYRYLRQRYNAPGDFAQAYVIAHEIGHHVQALLGVSDKVQSMQNRISEEELPLVFAATRQLEWPLERLLALPGETGQGEGSNMRRGVIMSGISEKELHMILGGYRSMGLPAQLWATLTPTSGKWPLRLLLEELAAEREAMLRRQAACQTRKTS